MKDLSMVKVLNTPIEGTPLKYLLREILQNCWVKGESMSGKRPGSGVLGNSDWQTVILEELAGKENLNEAEVTHYTNLVTAAIRFMTL
jgi:hypothetical protein